MICHATSRPSRSKPYQAADHSSMEWQGSEEGYGWFVYSRNEKREGEANRLPLCHMFMRSSRSQGHYTAAGANSDTTRLPLSAIARNSSRRRSTALSFSLASSMMSKGTSRAEARNAANSAGSM